MEQGRSPSTFTIEDIVMNRQVNENEKGMDYRSER
jgi:hypothetical protein